MPQQKLFPMTAFQQRQKDATDNNWQGDQFSDDKPVTHTRLMFHNISHLSLYGTAGLEMFIHAQASLQVDIQAFSEHCLDTTKFQVTNTAKEILRRSYQDQATMQIHSSAEPAVNQYKPGGTGILVLGQAASRIEPHGRGGDLLGRWSYISFRRQHFAPITIISVYQVCPRPTNHIGNTAYHQQQRALAKQGRPIHPRKAFVNDMTDFITALQAKGHDIILGGDFNEALHDKNSGILQIATRHQLADPFLQKFPQHREFGTHINGSRRIDIVLVSHGLLPCIQAVGYAPFQFTGDSDHRPLLIDFTTSMLFGNCSRLLPPAIGRTVKSKDKVTVTKYISTLYEELHRHQIFKLQASLDDDTANPSTVENVDRLIGISEEIAENKCKPRRPEFYSRTIVRQRIEVSLLKRHLISLQRDQNCLPQLQSHMHRTGVTIDLPPTQALTRQALKQAQHRLRETCKASFDIRQTELDQRVQDLSTRSQKSYQKILSSIKKTEMQLKTYRVLKALRASESGRGSLNQIEIPNSWPPPTQPITSISQLEDPKTCTEWKLIRDPIEIEYYLMLRNRLHFGQAQGSPFTEPPLSQTIDWAASTEAANRILEGTYSPDIAATQVRQLLQECTFAASPDAIPNVLSFDAFRSKITSWREATTTSPSGRHLGRYKAMFVRIPTTEDEASPTFSDKQEQIARLKLSLINYCLRNIYVLQRWKTIVNVMIFKEPGNCKIHKLRVIHIYEADFNALCAIKWRSTLQYAVNHNLINEGQYGGRPGCEAQSLTLLEELKYDLSYLTRRSLFNFDNDATSCYDRIVVPLASLLNRKYGLDRKVVAVHATTLQEAKFRLKTATGISDLTYTHCSEFPIHGTGQGSGNSPCIWLFISSTLFDLHASQSYGASFYSPDGTESLRMSMVGFVDDSTGTCNDFQPQHQVSLDELFRRMEADAQLWSDLLYSTGGKLELQKCSFHLLHFQFLPNGRPVPTTEQYNNRIHVYEADTKSRIPIPSKRSFETHKTLGHHKAPNSVHPSTHILQEKADRLSLLLATSAISRKGARLAYQSIFLPSTKYTLPQSFYSRAQLEHAQVTSHARIFAKSGFNRNTARAILYAPTEFAGGGFIPWYLLQGEGQLVQFIKHWRTDTIVSKALRLTVCWAQWQSGVSTSILEDVNLRLEYLECRWLTSLRAFLGTINGHLHLDNSFVIPKERQHDIHIMDYAIQSSLFTTAELRVINYCRMYLHVTTLSELLDAEGHKINPHLFHCRREPWFNRSTFIPIQRRPSEYHIRTTWQKLCRQWVSSDASIAASLDMGPWLKSGEGLRRRRETYATHSHPRYIYHWKYGCYWLYKRSDGSSTTYLPVKPTDWEPTESCTPVTVQRHAPDMLLQLHRIRPLRSPKTPRQPVMFSEYVLRLSSWEKHLLIAINLHYGPYEIVNRLRHLDRRKTIYAVSDGSQTGDHISFGWVLGTDDGIVYAEHSGTGFGKPTSHRAEAWGSLSVMLFLHHLQQYAGITFASLEVPEIIFYSDNAGLIQRLTQRQKYSESYPNATLEPDWDLVEQTYTIATRLDHPNISFQWVRGHQDDTTNDLPTAAQYNIRADTLAGLVPHSPRVDTTASPWILPAERCQLVLNTHTIQGHYTTEIRTAYTLPMLFSYLTSRHQWSPSTVHAIDWAVFSQAARNSPIHATQLSKLVYDKLPTRYELSKSNPLSSPLCPYCTATETFQHICECTNPISTKFRTDVQDQVEVFLFRHGILEPIRTELLKAVTRGFLTNRDGGARTARTHSAAAAQEQIGLYLFTKGFISIEWRLSLNRIDAHYSTTSSDASIRILAGLVQILWTAQISLWKQHQDALNKASRTQESIRHETKRMEYNARVRQLHDKKAACLACHRDVYFHDDVEQYLATASLPQMKAYIAQYEPAILHSVKEAAKTSSRPLTSFMGFTRTTLHPPQLSGLLANAHQLSCSTRSHLSAPTSTTPDIRKYFRFPSWLTPNSTTAHAASQLHDDLHSDLSCDSTPQVPGVTHSVDAHKFPPSPLHTQIPPDQFSPDQSPTKQHTPISLRFTSIPDPESHTYPRLRNSQNSAGAFPHKHSRWKWPSPLTLLRKALPTTSPDPPTKS